MEWRFFFFYSVFLVQVFMALRAFFLWGTSPPHPHAAFSGFFVAFFHYLQFFLTAVFFCTSRVLHIPRRFQQAPSRFWLQVKRLKPNACLDQRFQPILPQASNHRRIVGA